MNQPVATPWHGSAGQDARALTKAIIQLNKAVLGPFGEGKTLDLSRRRFPEVS